MNLHSLNTAITLSAVLSSLGDSETTVCYDALKSAVTGVDLDTTLDSIGCDETDAAIVSCLSFMGVSDAVIEDMVSGKSGVSEDAISAISKAYASQYTQDELGRLAEEFAGEYTPVDMTSMDGVSPPRCKSGYKRKMVMKNNMPTWKCIRLFGKTRLSAKQKQALRKARLKAHSSTAEYSRKRSIKTGQNRGVYR
ncbi:hypothetical protein [Sulfurovum sp.]|uniref:hypothetical protein n=1 Tax=Sulfurovum sp. TaxID=1969726 RepID=UPI0025F3772E|nr:hypothetical protein [Sulfurovum sp.]